MCYKTDALTDKRSKYQTFLIPILSPRQLCRIRLARVLASSGKSRLLSRAGYVQRATTCTTITHTSVSLYCYIEIDISNVRAQWKYCWLVSINSYTQYTGLQQSWNQICQSQVSRDQWFCPDSVQITSLCARPQIVPAKHTRYTRCRKKVAPMISCR